jgi:hypothetical protein
MNQIQWQQVIIIGFCVTIILLSTDCIKCYNPVKDWMTDIFKRYLRGIFQHWVNRFLKSAANDWINSLNTYLRVAIGLNFGEIRLRHQLFNCEEWVIISHKIQTSKTTIFTLKTSDLKKFQKLQTNFNHMFS